MAVTDGFPSQRSSNAGSVPISWRLVYLPRVSGRGEVGDSDHEVVESAHTVISASDDDTVHPVGVPEVHTPPGVVVGLCLGDTVVAHVGVIAPIDGLRGHIAAVGTTLPCRPVQGEVLVQSYINGMATMA